MKNITKVLQLNGTMIILLLGMQLSSLGSFAQEERTATIKLEFIQTDTTKTCKATVLNDSSKPVAAVDVHLYVKRMYGLLPVGKVVPTDETGTANIDFPKDLPGDKNNMIVVIAKIENEDIYGNAETSSTVKWGVVSTAESFNWANRSLAASREKAPMFLIVVSTAIILFIWGTIFYVVAQLFKIKRSGKQDKKVNKAIG